MYSVEIFEETMFDGCFVALEGRETSGPLVGISWSFLRSDPHSHISEGLLLKKVVAKFSAVSHNTPLRSWHYGHLTHQVNFYL